MTRTTDGQYRYINNHGNVLLLFLPRVGITKRLEIFLDFIETHIDDGWQWISPSSSSFPKYQSKEDILQDSAYIEKYHDWHVWEEYNAATGFYFEVRFQAIAEDRWHHRASFSVRRSNLFFSLENFFSCMLILGNERQVRPTEFHIFKKIVEAFQPHYGFIYDAFSFENVSAIYPDPYRKHTSVMSRVKQTRLMHSPWSYYSRTMLFGPELIQLFGRKKLLKAPAYRILNMPNNSLLMYGTGRFYDVERLDVELIDAWRDESDILFEYDGDLGKYLGLSTDLMNY
ncbi:MAG: hypothetical protein AAF267_03920 [Deinococcota bacterium]